MTLYKNQIYSILAGMYNLAKSGIKRPNVLGADKYLSGRAIQRVELLLRSTCSAASTAYQDPRLVRITNTIQRSEEDELKAQLEKLLYEVDDIATLRLITGPRRIERVSPS